VRAVSDALDSASEQHVQEALAELCKDAMRTGVITRL